MYNNREYIPTHISTTSTTQLFTGRGTLQAVTINTTAAGTINILDGTASASTTVALIAASAGVGTYWYNAVIANGLRVITGAASDVTVTWTVG